jgi:hypothetical protein
VGIRSAIGQGNLVAAPFPANKGFSGADLAMPEYDKCSPSTRNGDQRTCARAKGERLTPSAGAGFAERADRVWLCPTSPKSSGHIGGVMTQPRRPSITEHEQFDDREQSE